MDFTKLLADVNEILKELRGDTRYHLVLASHLFDNYWIERDANAQIHVVYLTDDDVNQSTNLYQIKEDTSIDDIMNHLKGLFVESVIES